VGGLFQQKRIVGVDLSETKATLIQARKRFEKLEIEKFFVVEKSGDGEKRFPNVKGKLSFDIEDVIVTNAKMDSVIFITIDVPPKLKRREYEEMAKLEAARNFGISAEEILSTLVGRTENKGIFAIAKKENISETVLKNLEDLGIGEPDVLIPDVFKYLYAIDVSLKGNLIFVVLSFVNNYIAVILQSFMETLGIRVIFRELSRMIDFIRENSGMDVYQIESTDELNDTEIAFLKGELADLSLEIVREISLTINESIQNISLDDINAVVLITDPNVFEDIFKEAFSSVNSNLTLGKFSLKHSANFPNIWLNIYKGALGLTLRGVESGRIKSVFIKKKKG